MTSRVLEVGMTDGWGIKVGGKGMGEVGGKAGPATMNKPRHVGEQMEGRMERK